MFCNDRLCPLQFDGIHERTFRAKPVAVVNQLRHGGQRFAKVAQGWQKEQAAFAEFAKHTVTCGICTSGYHGALPRERYDEEE